VDLVRKWFLAVVAFELQRHLCRVFFCVCAHVLTPWLLLGLKNDLRNKVHGVVGETLRLGFSMIFGTRDESALFVSLPVASQLCR